MSPVQDTGVFPAWKELRCISTPSERCAFSGHSTSIVKLQVISHLHRTACTVINLDGRKGREIDGPSVIASFAWQSKP